MSRYKVTFIPGAPNHCWNKAAALIKDGSTVLDVGCSNGDFGRALQEYKQCKVDGIEPDAGDAKKATNVLWGVFQGSVEDTLKTKLQGRKYNHIVFLDVIEHLYDPAQTLSALKKHLIPGGSIVFSIPNMAHVSVRLMLLCGELEYGKTGLLDNTHLHFYTKHEINRVLGRAGYQVTVWDYTEATYPDELVASKLKEIGLTSSKKALSILNDESGKIFQYVGVAVVSGTKGVPKVASYSPDPQGEISNMYENRITNYEMVINEKDTQLNELYDKLQDQEFLASRIRLRNYVKSYIRRKLANVAKKREK